MAVYERTDPDTGDVVERTHAIDGTDYDDQMRHLASRSESPWRRLADAVTGALHAIEGIVVHPYETPAAAAPPVVADQAPVAEPASPAESTTTAVPEPAFEAVPAQPTNPEEG